MAWERTQFGILFRNLFLRIVDFELLSPDGDIHKLLIQVAAMLAAFNFVVVVILIPRYGLSPLSHSQLAVNAWSDEEFLIATTIVVAGLFTVFAWNTLLPDRRDALALGVLPVKTSVLAFANVASTGAALLASITVVNIFSSLAYAFVASPTGDFLGTIRCFAVYWLTIIAAGVFTCLTLLSAQGLAMHLLGRRLFLRFSGFLQLAAFFLVLGMYFLKPSLATPADLSNPANQRLLSLLPSYWFLGLFQELNGTQYTVFSPLARLSLWGLLASSLLAASTYVLAYRNNLRWIIEQPDIVPGSRNALASRFSAFLAARFFRKPLERTVVLFTVRSLARSRQHRLLMAFYCGIGLAIALAYSESLLHGNWLQHWAHPNAPLLIASLVLLFFAVVGVRMVFTFPLALRANVIFRITAVHSPAAYFRAVRKALYVLSVWPVCMGCALFFLLIWPNRPALQHIALLVTLGTVIAETSLHAFRKVPFACSYLPGKATISVKFALYGSAILFFAHQGGLLEFWALHRFARYVVVMVILLVAAVWSYRRSNRFADAPENGIQFEDLSPDHVFALDLSRDGAFSGNEAYVPALDPASQPSWRTRFKLIVSGILIAAVSGLTYERVGEWLDQKHFPQVGHSVDIGGRSLNMSCLGQGSPVVILESNIGAPGYSWIYVQRQIAKFTRVCWYDRAGDGWSDPGPFPNHSDSIAHDLHKLLTNARIPPPYLLVGHAMGAFHVRVYRGLYPDEVAGLILVDPMHEDLTIHIHNHIEAVRPAVVTARTVLGMLGVPRLLSPDPGPPPSHFTAGEWATITALAWQSKSIVEQTKELPFWVNGEMARASGNFGQMPVTVLSAGIQDQEEDPKLDHDLPLKLELQLRLAHLSARGTRIIVSNSNHQIPYENPAAIVNAVMSMVLPTAKQLQASTYPQQPSLNSSR